MSLRFPHKNDVRFIFTPSCLVGMMSYYMFVLCENNNLSTANSEIRNRFITTDGYHLSDEGVKMLASNLRRSIDKVLDIAQNPMRKDPRPRRPWRRPNEPRQRRDSVSQ